jgi:sulfopyruvate decarboxylase subunit beta
MSAVDTRPSLDDALEVLHRVRREHDIVVTTMAPARVWMQLGAGPRDLVLVPSAMGHATSFGLGLALAQPSRRVVVCNGDGSMLMNLGALVSITAAAPPNLVLIVFDNGVYEVTGSQPTPGAAQGRAGAANVDFAAMARAAGFPSVFRFSELAAWTRDIQRVLQAPGPTFAAIDVMSIPGTPGPRSPGPAGERAKALMAALKQE